MTLRQRCLIAFGITDETFTVASLEKNRDLLSLYGRIDRWSLCRLGNRDSPRGIVCTLLPDNLQNALGITLYAMFIALVLPPAKKSPAVRWVAAVAVGLSSALTWLPGLRLLSAGWRIMIATLIACLYGAYFFPRKEVE